jgi:LPS-assembly lipoprotein
VQPRYRLIVNVRQRVQAPLVDTVTGRATSGMLIVDADYRLLPIAGGPPVASGVAFVTASYDRTSQRFANLRAARDGEIRSARSLADQIRTRLAADLSRRT